MNQNFRERFNQSMSNDTMGKEQEYEKVRANAPDIEYYDHYSGIRNVCFTHSDRCRIFLNYNYLVSGEYSPEQSQIVLGFTTHQITLQGINLESFFEELMFHSVKVVGMRDQRYNDLVGRNAVVVNLISIKTF